MPSRSVRAVNFFLFNSATCEGSPIRATQYELNFNAGGGTYFVNIDAFDPRDKGETFSVAIEQLPDTASDGLMPAGLLSVPISNAGPAVFASTGASEAAPIFRQPPIIVSGPGGAPAPRSQSTLPPGAIETADAGIAPSGSPDAAMRRLPPIVVASAPPPPGAFRRASPDPTVSAPATVSARGDLMRRQVERRRAELAAEEAARAEAARAVQLAEQRRIENQQRVQADNDAMWGAVFTGVVQGVQAYVQTQAEMDALFREQQATIAAAARSDQEYRERQAREQSAREADARRARDTAASQQLAQQPPPAGDMAAQLRARQAEDEAALRREEAETRQREAAEQARRVAQDRENQQRAEAEARRQAAAAASAERNRLVEFKETVTLCERIGASGERGEWTCHGPLQRTWGRFDTASGMVAVRQGCGSDSVRDLGVVGTYRAFGCGFGIHPLGGGQFDDIPERYGVSFIPGRIIFRCPNSSSNTCRTQ